MDLSDEIALLRVCVTELKELADEHKDNKRREAYRIVLREAINALESVSRVAKTLSTIEATYFSIEAFHTAIEQLVNIIKLSITVCPHCGKELSQLVREIGMSIRDVHLQGSALQIDKGDNIIEVKSLSPPKSIDY